ncbi:AMP-binding protein [Pseudonocardia sp. NPDC049154]|uniref:class I adenylate-forming enzyme family protein n=1 Tax=Pseudonocardia sp. NPDC049154 TaxID=3155501 RepID=UPI0033C07E82
MSTALPPLDAHGLVRWSPKSPPAGPRTVAAVLDGVLEEDPDRLAVVGDDDALTYAELDTAVNRVAAVLREEGLQPGDRVAMCLPNSADIVVGFLAAMRLGAIWVGINRALAAPERETILADSGATLLLAEPGSPDLVGPRTLRLDEELRARLAAASDARPDVVVDPDAPAAIAYTSGTTGTPKGAVHSQHNMLLPAVNSLLEGAIPVSSRQGVVLPLTILNLQILGPVSTFVCGATCVPLRRIDVLGLAEGVRRHRVQRMSVPPTTAYDLLTRPEIRTEDIESLTELGVGGAGAPPGLNQRYRARFGRLFSTSYGLTEAPTAATIDTRDDRPEGSAGQALGHLVVTVTDPDGAPLPAGEEGEIRVGPRTQGPFADVFRPMLGYWNRPDATVQAVTGDGWLRTGDQGRLEPDGSLVVVGRRNDLIVRGGANVYPAEVEQALCTHPDVAEAAVVGRPDERLGETVVAVVRRRAGAELDEEELRSYCGERLARYKVPAEIRFVAELPRNAMGKVVKKLVRARLEEAG